MNSATSSHRTPVVAVVDPNQAVTESIEALLHSETDYRTLTYNSPLQAIKGLRQTSPDIIIAAFKMPKMNGLQLLDEIKKMYPDVPRVLLTDEADMECLIKGINEVGLFQYIQKPWNDEHLLLIIKNGLANKNLHQLLQEKIHEFDQVLNQRDVLFEAQNVIQHELTLAKQVHTKLLLPGKIRLDGISINVQYKPTFEIGGDFYDVIPLANHRVAIMIADLTGHGIQAALCTALLKFAFTAFKESSAEAIEILQGMNEILYKGLPQDIYAAAMLTVIDTETWKCKIVNGGIPHPFLLSRRSGNVEKFFASGMMLGLFENNVYEPGIEAEIQLGKNDTLFLFTDGLTDIRQREDSFFGDHLVADTIEKFSAQTSESVIKHLVHAALKFKKGGEHLDDITVMAIDRS